MDNRLTISMVIQGDREHKQTSDAATMKSKRVLEPMETISETSAS